MSTDSSLFKRPVPWSRYALGVFVLHLGFPFQGKATPLHESATPLSNQETFRNEIEENSDFLLPPTPPLRPPRERPRKADDQWSFHIPNGFRFESLRGYSWAYDIPASQCVSRSDSGVCRDLTLINFRSQTASNIRLVCSIAIHSSSAQGYQRKNGPKVNSVYDLEMPSSPTNPPERGYQVSSNRYSQTLLLQDNHFNGIDGPGLSFISCQPEAGQEPITMGDDTVAAVLESYPFGFQHHRSSPGDEELASHSEEVASEESESQEALVGRAPVPQRAAPHRPSPQRAHKPTSKANSSTSHANKKSVHKKTSPPVSSRLHFPTDDRETEAGGCFGPRRAPVRGASSDHNGMDLMAEAGEAVYAAERGTILQSGWLSNGCGWGIEIQHTTSLRTSYCHLQSKPKLKVGNRVTRGQVIARVGSTGAAEGPHLHFVVKINGVEKNPNQFLNGIVGACAKRAPAKHTNRRPHKRRRH